MGETKLKSKVALELRKAHNCFVVCFAGGEFQMSGLPDMEIVKDGLHIWVETKGPDTVVEPLQNRVHCQLREQKARVFILTFLEEHRWILEESGFGYQIQFKTFREGVNVLYRTLLDICSPKQLTTLEIFR